MAAKNADGITYKRCDTITPNDTDVQAGPAGNGIQAIKVTDDTSGNIVSWVDDEGNQTDDYCIKGVIYPIAPKIVHTDTTADTVIGYE